ncbi:hypothetical protein [Cytobacillus oceanisediminis]|uniref:hypothetical protein n=1 Tax=Cytobacillus oceanisediminis TaxID=665099 RepID=UPI00203E087B|nr:hypothetical protein [Cytobacillus oceanisediminis]MCM3405497.1 hypothetical protein [Cytobacillus oceanisediminis]
MLSNIKNKKIVRHDDSPEFNEVFYRVKESHPNDIEGQLQAFSQEKPLNHLLGLSRIMQEYLQENKNESVNLSPGQLELIFRSITDLTTHTQVNLPDGVYKYNLGNLKGVTKNIIEQIKP